MTAVQFIIKWLVPTIVYVIAFIIVMAINAKGRKEQFTHYQQIIDDIHRDTDKLICDYAEKCDNDKLAVSNCTDTKCPL